MARAKSDLTVAQKAYIEQFFGKKTPKELAEDTGLTVRKVKAVLKKLEEAGFESQPEPTPGKSGLEVAGFDVYRGKDADGNPGKVGTVSMTKSASEKADSFRQGKVPEWNEKFFKERVRNGIHVIDPSKPVY